MKPNDDQNWEMPLSQMMTYRLSRVHSKMITQASRILKKNSKLSLMQWRVLVTLYGAKDMTHSKLVAKTGLDGGQLSRCVNLMLENKLLEAKIHKSDSRQQHLSMTPKGLQAYKEARPFMRHRQTNFIDALTNDERDVLFRILKKLEKATETEGFEK